MATQPVVPLEGSTTVQRSPEGQFWVMTSQGLVLVVVPPVPLELVEVLEELLAVDPMPPAPPPEVVPSKTKVG
jgi:hypothetical protein